MKPARVIGDIYLGYLVLLPAIGTFVLLAVLKVPVVPLIFFLAGTAAVGLYLAVTVSYTPVSKSAWKNLLRLIDTPSIIVVSALLGGLPVAQSIVEIVLIEVMAVVAGIFALSGVSDKPTKEQRRLSLIVVGLPLAALIALFWSYLSRFVAGDAIHTVVLFGAIIQASAIQFGRADEDHVRRPAEWFIVAGILIWLAAFIAGNVLQELQVL